MKKKPLLSIFKRNKPPFLPYSSQDNILYKTEFAIQEKSCRPSKKKNTNNTKKNTKITTPKKKSIKLRFFAYTSLF